MIRKTLLFLGLFYCGCCQLAAQGKVNTKLVIETGFSPLERDAENLGIFLNLEQKVRAADKTFVGLRFGIYLNSYVFQEIDPSRFEVDYQSDNGILSFVPTLDYYLEEGNRRPYLGIGIGYHYSPIPLDVLEFATATSPETVLEGKVKGRIGLLLRAGYEVGKLRAGIEYSLIPNADLTVRDGQKIGRVVNSNLSLSIGFLIFGGKRLEGV